MRARGRHLLAVLTLPLWLGGCLSTLVGPDYEEPTQPDMPAHFTGPAPEFAAAPDSDSQQWWSRFQDPMLDELIARGLRDSPTIRTAESRVREARTVLTGTRSDKRPGLDGQTQAGIEGNRTYSDVESREDRGLGGAFGMTAIFDWTLDLFGGLQRAVEAAEADVRGVEAERRAAVLTLIGEIASRYVELRGAQTRLSLSERAIDLQQQSLAIVSQRVEVGLASQLDLSRARAELATLRAERAPIRGAVNRTLAALAVLVGTPPGRDGLPSAVRGPGAQPVILGGPGYGVPLDMMRRRPDIMVAEAEIMRTTAEIGVAEAALYPSLSLPGRIGLDVSDLATGETVSAIVGSLFLALEVPFLDGGRREAELEGAKERAQQAIYAYRSQLLIALAEVEEALEGLASSDRRRTALEEAAVASRKAFDQANARYRQGLAGYIDVLDAQRTLTDRRFDLAETRTDLGLQAIALYRAVGLGPPLGPVPPRAPSDTPSAAGAPDERQADETAPASVFTSPKPS